MKQHTAIILGFLIAPMVPVAGAAVLSPPSNAEDLYLLAVMSAIVYVYGLFLTGVLALPAYLILRRFNLVNFLTSVITGLLISLIFSIVIHIQNVTTFEDSFVKSCSGACAGFVFWLFWRAGRNASRDLSAKERHLS